jgi:hypothetical protein
MPGRQNIVTKETPSRLPALDVRQLREMWCERATSGRRPHWLRPWRQQSKPPSGGTDRFDERRKRIADQILFGSMARQPGNVTAGFDLKPAIQ